MNKRTIYGIVILAAVCLFISGALPAFANDYNFIKAKTLQERIQANSPMIMVDICPAKKFAAGHIKGSIETNAYPVKTDDERARLAAHLPKIKASKDDVVIVCPKGGGGAKRTYEFYKSKGVKETRLLILKNGLDGWPFERVK